MYQLYTHQVGDGPIKNPQENKTKKTEKRHLSPNEILHDIWQIGGDKSTEKCE